MRITSLTICNLRNLQQVQLELEPGTNVFHGPNGAGKTTVIESLLVLAKGSSFRGGSPSSLIGPHADHFLVRAQLLDDINRKHSVALQRGRSDWEGRIDGEPLQQISDTAQFFPMILMEPTTHELIGGPPEGRRRYLDWTVFHVKHEFLLLWRRYVRALKQRNAALRDQNLRMVKSMDPQLVSLGTQLTDIRSTVFNAMLPQIVAQLRALSPRQGQLEIVLQQGWSGESLQEALEAGLHRDMEQGYTREGPHRADLSIKIENKVVRDRLSRGEQKILAGAMTLAQGAVFREAGHVPVLLLDDLASEFDADHLRAIVEGGLALGSQLIITGTSAQTYHGLVPAGGAMFHVKQGVITRHKIS